MPPKKKSENVGSAKSSKVKITRRRIKQEKPPLKIPTVIKMKLPSIKTVTSPIFTSGIRESSLDTKKTLPPSVKLELANEVAMAQFRKPPFVVIPDNSPIKIKFGNKSRSKGSDGMKNKLKRGRPKKPNDINLECTSSHATESPPITAAKKRVCRQPRLKTINEKTDENIASANNEEVVTKSEAPDTETPANITCKKPTRKRRAGLIANTLPKAKPVPYTEKELLMSSPKKPENNDKEYPPVTAAKKKRVYVRSRMKIFKHNTDQNIASGNSEEVVTESKEVASECEIASKCTFKKLARKRRTVTVPSTLLIDNPVSSTNKAPLILSPKKKQYIDKGKILEDTSSPSYNKSSPSILEMEKISNYTEKTAGIVDSRKTSLSSVGGYSWTKDISSSSSTTCVTVYSANEFVRFDKKMPVIKLKDIKNQPQQTTLSDGSSSSDDSESNSDSNDSESTKCSVRSNYRATPDNTSFLNLSTSSICPTKSPATPNRESNHTNVDLNDIYKLQKISSKLKKADLEIINWIGHDDDPDLTKVSSEFQDVILVLKHEREVINICRDINNLSNNILSYFTSKDTSEKCAIDENREDNNIINDVSLANENREDNNIINDVSLANVADKSDNELAPDKFDTSYQEYMNFDQPYNNDDDDALSIFAEDSLTGMDTTRVNSTAASVGMNAEFEEYIPLPVNKLQTKPAVTYSPSKINETTELTVKSTTVCNKQNADSTNVECEPKQTYVPESLPEPTNEAVVAPQTSLLPTPSDRKTPRLMSTMYKPMIPVKSVVFRGVCFFNLTSNCKKNKCLFPHQMLTSSDIQDRLTWLKDDLFIQEYMMIRCWPDLRKNYGRSFAIECEKRKFSRILVEMAYDFRTKSDNPDLKTQVLELTLMHMNSVDLEVCNDLLNLKVDNKFLYDVFMEELAETPNFSRFKPVFVKLTDFIVNRKDKFSLQVAISVLERFCILPYDTVLAKALIKIVMNTSQSIFKNPIMRTFEKQLCAADEELYVKFLEEKERIVGSEAMNTSLSPTSPRLRKDERINLMDRERYTSPDTTKLDNMNKTIEEPIVIRKNLPILNKHLDGINNSFAASSVSSNDSSYRPSQKAKFRHWRIPRFNVPSLNRFQIPMRPPMHKMRGIQRQVSYGPSPPIFPRRSTQNF